MADFDLFNGDGDGIFSLLQLRQTNPRPDAELVTGVKRDIKLFPRIKDRVRKGDRIVALDISMKKNTEALQHVLDRGASVFYCDHHQTGAIPQSDNLTVITSDAKVTCTAHLINRHLEGAKAAWAVCGAFGDNFGDLARRIADDHDVKYSLNGLRELGELVNYNAYGLTLDDLHFHPSDLYCLLLNYSGPETFLEDQHPALATLKEGYEADWEIAQSAHEIDLSDAGQILGLPGVPASNRIGGLFGNALVEEEPEQAFAILTELNTDDPSYRVSIRAPRTRGSGSAAELAARYGGGGRPAAAGIDDLAEKDLPSFIDAFRKAFA